MYLYLPQGVMKVVRWRSAGEVGGGGCVVGDAGVHGVPSDGQHLAINLRDPLEDAERVRGELFRVDVVEENICERVHVANLW